MKTMTLKKFLLLLCCWGVSTHGFAIRRPVDLDSKSLGEICQAMLVLPTFGAIDAAKSIIGGIDDGKQTVAVEAFIKKHPVGPNLKKLLKSENPLERDLGLILLWAATDDPKDNKDTKAMKKAIRDVYGIRFYRR